MQIKVVCIMQMTGGGEQFDICYFCYKSAVYCSVKKEKGKLEAKLKEQEVL